MTTRTNRARFKRLTLQFERDLLSEAPLRTLLTAAGTTDTGRRQERRTVEDRLKRTRRVN